MLADKVHSWTIPSIHPSINTMHSISKHITSLILHSWLWGAGVHPSCVGVKARLHPGQVASLSQGHIERQTTIHIHTYRQFRVIYLNKSEFQREKATRIKAIVLCWGDSAHKCSKNPEGQVSVLCIYDKFNAAAAHAVWRYIFISKVMMRNIPMIERVTVPILSVNVWP